MSDLQLSTYSVPEQQYCEMGTANGAETAEAIFVRTPDDKGQLRDSEGPAPWWQSYSN